MTFVMITEGGARARVPRVEKVSKAMEVFYNPVMKLNRDVTSLLLHTFFSKPITLGSPLAGTGIRECRLLVELGEQVKELWVNDYDEKAVALIKQNLKLNTYPCHDVRVSCNEASKFLLESYGFTYIDIDPFGQPGPFLDAAIKRVQRSGILAVTATDTSALSGTYVESCLRKYWARPMRNHLMHEVGLRILIRKVQLLGAQYEKSLLPVYSYSKDHYMRVFFLCEKQKRRAAAVVKQHQYFHYCPRCLRVFTSWSNHEECCNAQTEWAGPLWVGPLWDARVAREMAAANKEWVYGQSENQKFLDVIAEEARADVVGFYPFNLVRKVLKKVPKKKEELLAREGVFPTHLESNGVRAERRDLLF